jgi:predicted alternative tryptophan synthase beta-subunit
MNIDFENALKQEPVQAIMMVMMRYLTDEQRKIVYEKLGRRVCPSPTDESALKDEAEALYPYEPSSYSCSDMELTDGQRAAYIEGRKVNIERIKELENKAAGLKKILTDNGFCQMCYERKRGKAIVVCDTCYDSFDGDRRSFWDDDFIH